MSEIKNIIIELTVEEFQTLLDCLTEVRERTLSRSIYKKTDKLITDLRVNCEPFKEATHDRYLVQPDD